MTAYLARAKLLLSKFSSYEVTQIPRAQNERADKLARLTSSIDSNIERSIPIEYLDEPSIKEDLEILQVDHVPSWMEPIFNYLIKEELPDNPLEAKKIKYRATRYLIINGSLYKRGYSTPYLRCVTLEDGRKVLKDIHEGICGNHSGARSLAFKTLRQGYFWPTLREDARIIVQICKVCQKNSFIPHQPAEPLTSMSGPYPFAIWGLDLIGPMPKAKNKATHAIVGVDYCSKWAEAEALTTNYLTSGTKFHMEKYCMPLWRPICFGHG